MGDQHSAEGDSIVDLGDNDMAHAGGAGGGVRMEGVLSHERVREMVGDADPPEATRAALHHRVACLADYRVLPREDPARGPRVEDAGLDGGIVEHLRGCGIGELHGYQFEAIRRILGGKSVVIEAPTAFGKTEAFLAPVAHLARRMPSSRILALFVYPTKALGRDQLPKVQAMAESAGVRASIFDGNTGGEARYLLARQPPEFLVTNFDLIHHQMFRNGPLAAMLRSVRFVVVDEAHCYAGAFGANVHHVIARLKRLAGPIQCIGASATLNDSGKFCSALFGQGVDVIRAMGRRAAVDMAMVAPPEGIPKHRLMANLAKILASRGKKIMVFSNTHRNAELVGRELMLDGLSAGIHRGGMAEDRLRRAEAQFRKGELDMLSCTPTMELGVDIGGVDGVVSEGVPPNRFMQRIGRAGREGERGCAFLVLGRDPISRYYMERPDDYMGDGWIPHIDVTNADIEDVHTVAAALDRPLDAGEAEARAASVGRCAAGGWLEQAGQSWRATERGRHMVTGHSIRGMEAAVAIRLHGRTIGRRSLPMALSELHEGAIYMLGGRPYRVASLARPRPMPAAGAPPPPGAPGHAGEAHRGEELEAKVAPLPPGTREHTMALGSATVEDIVAVDSRTCLGAAVDLCSMRVTQTIDSYLHYGDQGVAHKRLERPLRHSFGTRGVRFLAPAPSVAMGREGESVAGHGSYHAIGHLVANAGRMVAGADASDVDGALGVGGAIYIYDNIRGGSGISATLYERMERVIRRAYDIVSGCPCREAGGCPRCTMSYRCASDNAGLHKAGAIESLGAMASAPPAG